MGYTDISQWSFFIRIHKNFQKSKNPFNPIKNSRRFRLHPSFEITWSQVLSWHPSQIFFMTSFGFVHCGPPHSASVATQWPVLLLMNPTLHWHRRSQTDGQWGRISENALLPEWVWVWSFWGLWVWRFWGSFGFRALVAVPPLFEHLASYFKND